MLLERLCVLKWQQLTYACYASTLSTLLIQIWQYTSQHTNSRCCWYDDCRQVSHIKKLFSNKPTWPWWNMRIEGWDVCDTSFHACCNLMLSRCFLCGTNHAISSLLTYKTAWDQAGRHTDLIQSQMLKTGTHITTYQQSDNYNASTHNSACTQSWLCNAGNPYADEHGAFGDNVFRYTLLSMAACEAPLVLPIGGYRSVYCHIHIMPETHHVC